MCKFLSRFFRTESVDISEETCRLREALDTTEKAIDDVQETKAVLADKLERTGFLPGDAIFGRIDTRYLPDRG